MNFFILKTDDAIPAGFQPGGAGGIILGLIEFGVRDYFSLTTLNWSKSRATATLGNTLWASSSTSFSR